MTSLTFYGGVKEIGGNKILLEDKKTRIWLDFGMSFSGAAKYYAEFLGPKKCNGVGDFIELGLVPDLKGLYREDYLKKMHRKQEQKAFDGILLSHAHFDHNGYFGLVRPDIPVYCSKGSKCVMDMLDTTSNMGEFLRQKKSFEFYKNQKGKLSRVTARTKVDGEYIGTVKRQVKVVDKPFKLGSLKVTPMPVDHSLPGATAFAIQTSKGTVVYTGDFRFHGLNAKLTRAFVKKASKFDPIALICEGTRIDSTKTETEKDVYDTVTAFSKNSKALIIGNYPVRDTDRMATFLKAAKDNSRRLVVSMRQAYLLKVFQENKLKAPKLKDVSIYAPRKSWGLITEKSIDPELVEKDYVAWERDFLWQDNTITCEELNKNQKDYLWRCDFFELKELIDVQPRKTSKYVWSMTEPFDVKMELNEEIVMNWLSHFNIKKIVRAHVSGHANQKDLKATVQAINAKKVFPVHTVKPLMFKKFTKSAVNTKKGVKYKL